MTLGTRDEYGDARYVGLELQDPPDILHELLQASSIGFDFVVTHIAGDPSTRPRDLPPRVPHLAPGFTPQLTLASGTWTANVVGVASAWADADADDPPLQIASESALDLELGWAAHVGLTAVVLPTPRHPFRLSRTARLALRHLRGGPTPPALWLRLPLDEPAGDASDSLATWLRWQDLQERHGMLGVMLELPVEAPSWVAVRRWLGEPVRALVVPTEIFITRGGRGRTQGEEEDASLETGGLGRDHHDPPRLTLTATHAAIIRLFLSHNVQVVLGTARLLLRSSGDLAGGSGLGLGGRPDPADGDVALEPPPPPPVLVAPTTSTIPHPPWRRYHEALARVFADLPTPDPMHRVSMAYHDVIQLPLQPLQDNLESSTYEVFERDAPKYVAYELAIVAALEDLDKVRRRMHGQQTKTATTTIQHNITTSINNEPNPHPIHHAPPSTPLMVFVVGAGRGPLVRAALSASRTTRIPIHVYAVEKNAHAVCTLRHRAIADEWNQSVTLVHADMRAWSPPGTTRADLIVSELLGSFGCNECSPECLEGALRHLARPHGICIPQRYTNYLQPVSASKAHRAVAAALGVGSGCWGPGGIITTGTGGGGGGGPPHALEVPAVVNFHRFFPIAEPMEAMTFDHTSSGPSDPGGGSGGSRGTGLASTSMSTSTFAPAPAPAATSTSTTMRGTHANSHDDHRGHQQHHARSVRATFLRPREQGVISLHGFAGYFRAQLYRDVTLSTHPADHTPGMYSWFPIFFPVVRPLRLGVGADVEVAMWRCCEASRVWYEWTVASEAEAVGIHNAQGRSYAMGLA